jgi:TetR/AcrR family transcriptional regulator, transcriptional repressor for nem operon
MRFNREHREQSRNRIVKNAMTEFRKNGPNGSSIADIMRAAGMTHGGFYLHFDSREALVRETLSVAMDETVSRWIALTEYAEPDEVIVALIEEYLSERHRKNPEKGCALPSYAAEIARCDLATRKVFSEKLRQMIVVLSQCVKAPKAVARQRSMSTIATMVGTMVLARAADKEEFADFILEAGRQKLLGVDRKTSVAEPKRRQKRARVTDRSEPNQR